MGALIVQIEKAKFYTTESDRRKILYSRPEVLSFYLEKEAAEPATEEARVKAYKVKVQYQPTSETEKKAKREAVAKVIL